MLEIKSFNQDLWLVGRVLCRKAIHLESFEKSMLGWNLMQRMNIQKIGENRLLFHFGHEVDKRRVLSMGPWAFHKNLVVLHPIASGNDPSTMKLDHCDFHVHASGVPVHLMHRKIAEFLANTIGSYVDLGYDESKKKSGSTIRFRVTIDINKPLRRMIQIMGPNGEELHIRLAYESLPNVYYYCRCLGHLVRDCHDCIDFESAIGEILQDKLAYGEWLRTHVNNLHSKYVSVSAMFLCNTSSKWDEVKTQTKRSAPVEKSAEDSVPINDLSVSQQTVYTSPKKCSYSAISNSSGERLEEI